MLSRVLDDKEQVNYCLNQVQKIKQANAQATVQLPESRSKPLSKSRTSIKPKQKIGKGKTIAILSAVVFGCCILLVGGYSGLNALGLLPTSTSSSKVSQLPTILESTTVTIDLLTQTPDVTPIETQTPSPTDTQKPASTITPIPTETAFSVIPPLTFDLAKCLPANTTRQSGTVVGIIDGDTIDVLLEDGGTYTVRYIGMDTPETDEPYFDEATKANSELIKQGEVTLVKDVSEVDRYDRLLRYVVVGNVFVNLELVKSGFAQTATYPPDVACEATFREAEQLARGSGLGLWSLIPPTATPQPGGPSSTGSIVITSIFYNGSVGNKEPDEYVQIRNDGAQSVQLQGWTLSDQANHVFTFPDFVIQPGQDCRIYTNEDHPEYCGFNYNFSKSAIWNNSGDCAYLRDSGGNQVDSYCY